LYPLRGVSVLQQLQLQNLFLLKRYFFFYQNANYFVKIAFFFFRRGLAFFLCTFKPCRDVSWSHTQSK